MSRDLVLVQLVQNGIIFTPDGGNASVQEFDTKIPMRYTLRDHRGRAWEVTVTHNPNKGWISSK